MEIHYEKHWSSWLNRDMEFKIYGHGGKPVLFIPCQGGRFFDFENFKMLDAWAPFIEAGQCTVYAADGIDGEAWAAFQADKRWRIENHEKWFQYIVNELVPAIRHIQGQRCGFDQKIMTFGCSLGAMHAANLFFRRPDLFDFPAGLVVAQIQEFVGDVHDLPGCCARFGTRQAKEQVRVHSFSSSSFHLWSQRHLLTD